MMNCLNILVKVLVAVIVLELGTGCSVNRVEQPDESWSFIVFGDPRGNYTIYNQLATNMLLTEPFPEFAVCCGDMISIPPDTLKWSKFWRASEPITENMELFVVRGNHEGNDSISEQIYREQTNIPGENFYYSFCWNNSYFIILDTEISGEAGSIVNDQLFWLTNQLDSISEISDIENIFLFMHRPLYPQGKYKGINLLNADELHALFGKYSEISIVFAGHEHLFNLYERDSINYITTGGGGTNLYSGYGGDYYHFVQVTILEDEKKIEVKTIGLLNEIIDIL